MTLEGAQKAVCRQTFNVHCISRACRSAAICQHVLCMCQINWIQKKCNKQYHST